MVEPSPLVVDVGGSAVDAVLDELVELDVASGAGRRRSSGGSGKSWGSRPSMAAVMKRCQISAGIPPPVTPSIGVGCGWPIQTTAV